MVVEFLQKRKEMAVVNTYSSQKKEECRLTYKSGHKNTEVNLIL